MVIFVVELFSNREDGVELEFFFIVSFITMYVLVVSLLMFCHLNAMNYLRTMFEVFNEKWWRYHLSILGYHTGGYLTMRFRKKEKEKLFLHKLKSFDIFVLF